MKRSWYGALLASASASAILSGMAGTAFAAWPDQAPVDAAVTVNSTTPYTSSGTVTGPAATSAGNGNGNWGNTSAGINITTGGATVNVTGGTVTGGTGGNGGNAAAGSNDGGDGGDSAGILFKTNLTGATINISQGATVQGGTGGNGGAAGGVGGTAGAAGSSVGGVDIRGANATLNNSGTVRSGIAGSNGDSNGGTASTVNAKVGAVDITGDGHATGATINNTATGQILGQAGYGIAVDATGATISNSGTISSTGNRAIYITPNGGNTNITNSGTITTSGTNAAAITNEGGVANITNQSGGVISATGGGAAIDVSASAQANHIYNNGTITGNVKLGWGSDGNHVLYLNSGSLLTGNVVAAASGDGVVSVGQSGSGIATIAGNIGSGSAPVWSLNYGNGATLAFSQDTAIYTGALNSVNGGGSLDFGKNKINVNFYGALGATETQSGTSYFKTTIDTGAGKHGYIVFSVVNGSGGTTLFSGSAPVIVPTVVGSVASGAKYVVVQDASGRNVVNMPSVVNSGGYRWTVASVTGAGQTDTDGVSYGTGYTDIVLTNAGSNAAATATGANGKAVSAIASYAGTNAAMQSLSNAVNNLTSDTEIQKAGAQLRPEVNGGTTQASLGAVNQALGAIQVRTDSVRAAAADTGGGTGVSSGESLKGLGVWAQGFGSAATQDRRQDVDGYNAATYGLAFGADARVLDPVRVGLSFAYARTNVDDTGSRDGSGQKINSYIGSLYGTYTANSWYVDGALTYGRHDYDATRVVNFTGATPQVAKSSFAGQQYGAKAEFGYPLSVGPAVVTPLASLAYNRLNQDGYTETGAAGANLTVGGSSTDSVRSGLGGKVSTTIAQAGEWNIKPNARAMWLHEFNGSAPDQTSTFVAGGSSFTTSGIQVAREHFNLGVGLDVASVRNTTVSAKYDADLSDRFVSHTGSLQVRTEF